MSKPADPCGAAVQKEDSMSNTASQSTVDAVRLFKKVAVDAVLFVLLTAAFTQTFTRNPLRVGEPYEPARWKPRVFETFERGSESSVVEMMKKTKKDGLWSTGGFMLCTPENPVPYLSAFGLQGKVFSLAYHWSNRTLEEAVKRSQFYQCLLFGIVLSAFVLFVRSRLGWTSAVFLTVGLCLSDWMVFAARNLMLVYPLHLIPCLVGFLLYPRIRRDGRLTFPRYAGVIASLVLVKSLCYFDYSSNLVLGTACAPIFFGIVDGRRWRSIVKEGGWMVAAAALAVAVAILAVFVQTAIHKGGLSGAFDHLLHKMSVRSFQPDQTDGAPPNVSTFQIFEQYLTLPILSVPFQANPFRYRIYVSFFAAIMILLPALALPWLDGRVFPRFERNRRVLAGWSAATLWGLVATLSWAFLMKGHMFHHLHMNGMIFYLPYLPLLYALVGAVLAVLCAQAYDLARGGGSVSPSRADDETAVQPKAQQKRSRK
jgi:hypothetical protein